MSDRPARQLLFCFRASGAPHPHPRVSYYPPSARQVPPIPIRASATILPSARQVRASALTQLLFALPRVRYPDLPSSARQFPPYSHPRVSYYFPSAHQVTPILIRASATIPLPRVRYPPPPSARQPFRAASAAIHPLTARQLLSALPHVVSFSIRLAACQVPPDPLY